ncbi:alpha/beta fold hydrolase [Ochrobactrum teleogrylli]|uniref:alpha/beta fold hydrolase n=1 Tax=Ochrobactrum teleogrylli TaxID=2479765 RepID=UPI00384B2FFE
MNVRAEQQFLASMDDGASILLRRLGNRNGLRLFITHGNGFAVDGYRDFWEPLIDEYELVLFDMRNHGHNPPAGGDGHGYRQFTRDLESIYNAGNAAFGAKPSVGVFHSMSARSALKQSVEGPRLWDALVLFDPPSVPPETHPLYEAMRAFEIKLLNWALERPSNFRSPEELEAFYQTNRAQARWTERSRTDMARAILRPVKDGWALSCQRELEAAIYLQALSLSLWPRASDLKQPAMLIGADPDRTDAGPTGKANRALALEGGFAYEAVMGTGHLLQIEEPQACRTAMVSFIEQLDFQLKGV